MHVTSQIHHKLQLSLLKIKQKSIKEVWKINKLVSNGRINKLVLGFGLYWEKGLNCFPCCFTGKEERGRPYFLSPISQNKEFYDWGNGVCCLMLFSVSVSFSWGNFSRSYGVIPVSVLWCPEMNKGLAVPSDRHLWCWSTPCNISQLMNRDIFPTRYNWCHEADSFACF